MEISNTSIHATTPIDEPIVNVDQKKKIGHKLRNLYEISYNIDSSAKSGTYCGRSTHINDSRKFYFLDLQNLRIFTNDGKLKASNITTFTSSNKTLNTKFRISKLLTDFFKRQAYIPNRMKNFYFEKIRKLLLVQYFALQSREQKTNPLDKKKTFTSFTVNYKKVSIFMGLYLPCSNSGCQNISHYVQSNYRQYCKFCSLKNSLIQHHVTQEKGKVFKENDEAPDTTIKDVDKNINLISNPSFDNAKRRETFETDDSFISVEDILLDTTTTVDGNKEKSTDISMNTTKKKNKKSKTRSKKKRIVEKKRVFTRNDLKTIAKLVFGILTVNLRKSTFSFTAKFFANKFDHSIIDQRFGLKWRNDEFIEEILDETGEKCQNFSLSPVNIKEKDNVKFFNNLIQLNLVPLHCFLEHIFEGDCTLQNIANYNEQQIFVLMRLINYLKIILGKNFISNVVYIARTEDPSEGDYIDFALLEKDFELYNLWFNTYIENC